LKNQYFGDKRDLLKYSLLEMLATRLPNINQLTCIWLLTAPAVNNDGNRFALPRQDASRLELFLHECVAKGRRDVRNFASYMDGSRLRYFSYGDEASSYFSDKDRTAYFGALPPAALKRSIVFFDPDNGLEPDKSCRAAHLRYEELASVFARMDQFSVAVVYQHLPRRSPSVFWPELAERLRGRLRCSAGYVAAGDVGFFIALRSIGVELAAATALEDFRESWPMSLVVAAPNRLAG
jgi:hypothetical protein